MSCDLRGCVERLLRFALRGMRAFLHSICTIRLSGGLTPLSTQLLIPIGVQRDKAPLRRFAHSSCINERPLVSDILDWRKPSADTRIGSLHQFHICQPSICEASLLLASLLADQYRICQQRESTGRGDPPAGFLGA